MAALRSLDCVGGECRLYFNSDWSGELFFYPLLPTFHWLSSVKISVSAMSTLFQAIASSSCLFQLSLPKDSLVLDAE